MDGFDNKTKTDDGQMTRIYNNECYYIKYIYINIIYNMAYSYYKIKIKCSETTIFS